MFECRIEGLERAIKQINAYQRSLPLKIKELEEKLMERGILVAEANFKDIEDCDTKSLITFKQSITVNQTSVVGLLMEVDISPIVSRWMRGGDVVEADVSPSWMLEFGSGIYAVEGHRGTFPNQTHAMQDWGWFWKTEDGATHHSKGIVPTYPMHKAMLEMYNSVYIVAKEVFR